MAYRTPPPTTDRIVAYTSLAIACIALFAFVFSIFQTKWQLKEMREDTNKTLIESRETAKMQHLVEEETRFDQESLLKARKSLAAKRIDLVHQTLRPLSVEAPPPEMWDILNFCDHVGLLTRRGYLNVEDVWGELGYWLQNIYADARPAIADDIKLNPASMKECTWLIESMRPIEVKENNGVNNSPSKDDIYSFYESERDAERGKLPPSRTTKSR